jgi:hypothetical protein
LDVTHKHQWGDVVDDDDDEDPAEEEISVQSQQSEAKVDDDGDEDPAKKEIIVQPQAESLDIVSVATKHRLWTEKLIRRYIRLGHGSTTWYGGHNPQPGGGEPLFSHALLETRKQHTQEPSGRSCLSGFPLLMRHARLWEMGVEGTIRCACLVGPTSVKQGA